MDQWAMREEILAYKRERILEEAVKLFYERGFTGTTLDDIAAELGVTKPFIYTHFRSKTESACRTVQADDRAVARRRRRALPKDPDRRPSGCIAPSSISPRWCCRARPTSRSIFARRRTCRPKRWPRSTRCARSSIACCQSCCPKALAAGEFDIKDVSLDALAIGGMISWAYTWHRPEGRLALDDMCERMADLALQMVGARSKVAAKLPASA